MPLIITATDFSDIADMAVNYACQLATATGSDVNILHSFFVPVAFSDTTTPVMPSMPVDDIQVMVQQRMDEYLLKVTALYPALNITGDIIYGDVIDSLTEYADEDKRPWLIVMGNSNDKDHTAWFGSTVVSAFRSLHTPVLAVPPAITYNPVRRLCFAYDNAKATGSIAFTQLQTLAATLGSELHILNVSHNATANEGAGAAQDTIHDALKTLQPQYHYIDSENVDDTIHNFVLAHNMDWLVVVPHKHSFFERLFHKSHTEAMIKMSGLPIIALHED